MSEPTIEQQQIETRAFRRALLFILCQLCRIVWECRPSIKGGYGEAGKNFCELADEVRERYLEIEL